MKWTMVPSEVEQDAAVWSAHGRCVAMSRRRRPVHDSRIFDGVDERQKALALQLAARESEARGFQYICSLNSDDVPWSEFEATFDLGGHVRLTLTDAAPAESLVGFRF